MQEFRPSYQGGGGGGGGGTFIFKVNWHFFYFDEDDNSKLLFQQSQPNGPCHGYKDDNPKLLFQKPAKWSTSWTMMKHSKSSDLSPAYSQVDPHSKSLVPIIVAGGKDGKILQTMIKKGQTSLQTYLNCAAN